MPLLTQHKIQVKVTGPADAPIPVLDWDKSSGGDITHSVNKVRRSAGKAKEILTGDSETDNITVEAFIDPAAHSGFLKALKDGNKYAGTAISLIYVDNAGVQVGESLTYTGCSVAKFTPPQADANGEEAAKLVIEWAVGG